MPDEQTPLITTTRVAAPRRRYPHNVLRRFCTIALSSLLIWFMLGFLITITVGPRRQSHDHDWEWPGCSGRRLSYEKLQEVLIETPSSEKAEAWSRYYTSGPHLAGQNYSQAVWTQDRWEEFGIRSRIDAYDVLLNRPVDHRLALLRKGKDATAFTVAFEASLKEDVLKDDPTSGLGDSVPTFHGYSASGNVTAPYVYVNYGTYHDYEDLIRANVSLKGKIAVARYGKIFRGLKVKRAQELGMVGVVLYTDPGDDGENTDKNGVAQYPEGPARQNSSVQRGSTQFLSVAPGDPTTPGYPSKPGVPRQPTDGVIPSIPSLPISYVDAIPILKALNGHGLKAKDLNKWWTADLGLDYKGVEYSIGPTPDDVVLNLYNEQEYVTTPIWNVIGIINGSIHDEVVVIGNHRDAWIAGGAGDPNSGSAVLNEVVRSFGKALEQGWKPLRTIVIASWDGEEYGLVGSTEWVEEYLPWLSKAAVAYLNVDVAVKGPYFDAAAAPLLNDLLYSVTAEVQSPNQTVKGQTVRDLWSGTIRTMGSGSDFTAFQDFAGVPSLDMGFSGGADSAVYHYHSNYDSFHWMQTFGDPGFAYHRVLAQILGLMTAKLADVPVISFRAQDYAIALGKYVEKAEGNLDTAAVHADVADGLSEDEALWLRTSPRADPVAAASHGHNDSDKAAAALRSSLRDLKAAAGRLGRAATRLDERADALARQAADSRVPWWRWPARVALGWDIRRVNARYVQLERRFLYAAGLDGRPWFKHVVFAPGLWTGYAGAVFPGLVESIQAGDFENAERWVEIIQRCIADAEASL